MTSGNSSYFVDANVLVYAALKDDSRHEVSKALLKDAGRGPLGDQGDLRDRFLGEN